MRLHLPVWMSFIQDSGARSAPCSAVPPLPSSTPVPWDAARARATIRAIQRGWLFNTAEDMDAACLRLRSAYDRYPHGAHPLTSFTPSAVAWASSFMTGGVTAAAAWRCRRPVRHDRSRCQSCLRPITFALRLNSRCNRWICHCSRVLLPYMI